MMMSTRPKRCPCERKEVFEKRGRLSISQTHQFAKKVRSQGERRTVIFGIIIIWIGEVEGGGGQKGRKGRNKV